MANTSPKAPKVVKAEKPKAPKGEFIVMVRYDDKEFTADTNDISGFLLSLAVSYIKTRTAITVEHNGRKVERMLTRPVALRLFRNKIAAMSFEKNIKLALNATN